MSTTRSSKSDYSSPKSDYLSPMSDYCDIYISKLTILNIH